MREFAQLSAPDTAVATFLSRVALARPQTETVGLDEAFGRVLAVRVDADDDYPNAPRSAMDGFALHSSGVPGTLQIVGEIAMGRPWPQRLAPGTAVRIPTGGVVPDGADAVVPIEDVRVVDEHVTVDTAIVPGDSVNPRGGDMTRGEAVFAPGRRIGGRELAVLATLGVAEVPVWRKPRIAVISTGDELVEPSARPRPGEIRDSNRYAIAGALRAMGAAPQQMPTVRDQPGALEAALTQALAACDGVMITGGSSVGERDLTPGAIASLGEPGVVVHGLRVKPGKPTVLAAIGAKPVIGLPGNPTSALMILEAVVAPIVAALVGADSPRVVFDAVLGAPARSNPGWTWYIPVAVQQEATRLLAHPLPVRSSVVSLPARADGYVIMGEAESDWAAGRSVRVHRFL